MVAQALSEDGFAVFDFDPNVAAWAAAAAKAAHQVLSQGGERRHGGTWFVGVDALPNQADGSIDGVPLAGHFMDHVTPPKVWHQAQLSVVFPGYPQKEDGQSDAAHAYIRNRASAHIDGLLPEGPDKRRFLGEPHGFILGLPLNECLASPLVVWKGSHALMQKAFAAAFAGVPPDQWRFVDVTEVYHAARRRVFEQCEQVAVLARPGQAILLNRHLLHGVAPWEDAAGEMRMIAYFRPLIPYADWL